MAVEARAREAGRSMIAERLRELTGRDFGPAPNASSSDQAGAVTKWKEWWKSQGRK